MANQRPQDRCERGKLLIFSLSHFSREGGLGRPPDFQKRNRILLNDKSPYFEKLSMDLK